MVMSATKQDPAKKLMSKPDAKTLLIHYATPSNRLDNDFWEIEKRRLIEACKHYRLEIPDWLTSK